METWDLNYHGTLTFARLWKINGRPNASVLANVLQDLEEQKDMDMEEEHLIAKNVCVTAFEGGSDTVSAVYES